MTDTAPAERHIVVEKANGVASITFNRPEKKNAYDDATMDEIGDAMVAFEADPDQYVGIVTGAGDAFSSGNDLSTPTGGRLRTVPNGIDLARIDAVPPAAATAAAAAQLGELAGRPVIVVLARRKDQHILLQALQLVQRPVVVACVGIEPDAQLRRLAAATPARHGVVFVPFSDQPLAFYRLASVAALPSRIEGLSLSLLEAMALGLPVLASDAGGNPDLIRPDVTGLLAPPLDPRAWAAALERLLGEPGLAARLGRAARDLVRRDHTLDRAVAETEGVYREALGRRAALSGGAH